MQKNPFNLKNKKIFVFGGSGLLGTSIVKLLLNFKATVYIIDIKKQKNLINNNKNLHFIKLDISDVNNLDVNLNSLISKLSCPDVMINCSYPTTDEWIESSFSKNKINILRSNIDIHLNTHCWISYKFCELMKKNKINGSIIQFGSIYGVQGQNLSIYEKTKMRENMNYSIIKGGIINFTKQLCSYYGKYNIRINTVSPGGIVGHIKGYKSKQSNQFIKNYSKFCPMKRLGKPEEVANAVLFLSSDASSYISGINLLVDGGWTAI